MRKALIVLLWVPQALAQTWVQLGVDNTGNKWSVDKASLLREGDVVNAWKRIEFAYPEFHPPTGKKVAAALFLDATDCRKRLAGVKASKLLAPDRSVIATSEVPGERVAWQAVAAGTLNERVLEFVCRAPPRSAGG